MPSSADAFDAAIDRAVEAVQDAVAAADDPHQIVLIDGRSGSGKTTLAARLRERWHGPASVGGTVQVVALDDLYPGWDGLAQGAAIACVRVLGPVHAGRSAWWRRWDWARSAPGDAVRTRADAPLVIEGAGLLTEESAALASIRVWLESPTDSRRARALARDGETYRPHWERWAAQEDAHLTAHDPRHLATIVVDVP